MNIRELTDQEIKYIEDNNKKLYFEAESISYDRLTISHSGVGIGTIPFPPQELHIQSSGNIGLSTMTPHSIFISLGANRIISSGDFDGIRDFMFNLDNLD